VREANVAAARAAVPGATLTDQQQLGSGAPNGFQGMTAYAINQISRLNAGVASLSNTMYSITGAASSGATRDQVVSATVALPAGFALARQEITAPAAPTPPPAPPAEVVLAPPAAPPLPVVPVPAPAPLPVVPAPVVVAPVVITRDVCQDRFTALLSEPILFGVNSDVIQPVSYAVLARLSAAAKSCPGKDIEIGAHTDSDGDAAYNVDLSQRRAASVREFLIRDGVAGIVLKSVGYGETKPIAPNDTPANKAKNRRVVFTVK
jgi:OmpA-OmpF porin, OOP family